MKATKIRFPLVIPVLFVLAVPRVFSQASFQGLGDLPGGTVASHANGISADGLTVVGASQGGVNDYTEAFRWTQAGGMVGLGFLRQGTYSLALDASGDGSVVIGYSGIGFGRLSAFRWAGGFMDSLGYLPGDSLYSEGYGISPGGTSIVGISYTGSHREAFRWTGGDDRAGVYSRVSEKPCVRYLRRRFDHCWGLYKLRSTSNRSSIPMGAVNWNGWFGILVTWTYI